MSEETAFDLVAVVTVRVSGSNGSVETPLRLLSGVGASLYVFSVEALDAFSEDAIPRLGSVGTGSTTITVGDFYDLTVVTLPQSSLAYVFTPVGVEPPPGAERIGA